MDIRDRLESAIGGHRLLKHPFYVAWREGTLPRQAIATYAREYGALIAGIDAGWATVGEHDHAAEEREHATLWDRFAESLGTSIDTPTLPEVSAMTATAARLFAEPATAWGALYAFEAQQPGTSEEKLAGLVAHYGFDADEPATEYFRLHAADYHEADQIMTALEADPGAADRSVAACAEMSAALWDALSGVLATV